MGPWALCKHCGHLEGWPKINKYNLKRQGRGTEKHHEVDAGYCAWSCHLAARYRRVVQRPLASLLPAQRWSSEPLI